jgi:hypothetical protein
MKCTEALADETQDLNALLPLQVFLQSVFRIRPKCITEVSTAFLPLWLTTWLPLWLPL